MANASDFTFSAYVFATQKAVNAAGPMTVPTHFMDRDRNHIVAQPGDYVLQDDDGLLRVMRGALFEAEYSAVGATTAPNTLTFPTKTVSAIDLSWTVGSATALPKVYRDGVLIATNAANDGTYSDTGLAADTEYDYSIVNVLNERPSTALTGSAFTRPENIVDAPTAEDVAATTIDIAWVNANDECETVVYVDGAAVATVDPGETEFQITGLTTATEYLIKLKHKGVVSDLESTSFSATLTQTTD